ncbi:MAG: divergent PAP2 family protein [bacterium]
MTYALLIAPILAIILSQAIKLALDGIKGNFNLKNLIQDYGGMPSAHTSFVICLLTLILLTEGPDSPLFAVMFILTALVIRDAIGLRREIGRQGRIINQILRKNNLSSTLADEQIGHSGWEIIAGGFLGVIIALLAYLWFIA